MCGICGAVSVSGAVDVAEAVRLMTPTMRHRGPDDEGYLGGERLAIGMRRLSIIDIEGGHQPIFNEDDTVGAVLNGEIYNFQELRSQLEDRGHAFRTRSDSEVVVHAYEEWGAECVERLQGMFALAVWDGRRRRSSEFRVPSSELRAGRDASGPSEDGTLFLARDRMGIKPLYYYAEGGEFRVSSSSEKFRVSSSEFRVKTETTNSAIETSRSELETRNSKLETVASELETRNSKLETVASELTTRNSKLETVASELKTRNSKLETVASELETWNLKLETFLFASEVRTLLASGVVPRVLSRAAVDSYLLFGSVSEPMTLIENVFSLPPGHCMTIDLGTEAGSANIRRYWSIAANGRGESKTRRRGDGATGNGHATEGNIRIKNPPATAGGTDRTRTAAKRVRSLLEQSVRSHLIADVPVGVFLSSGIDSTALAALANAQVSGVHTFTVAFPEGEFSEAALARRTADSLGTTHREVMLSGDEMLARLGDAVSALDQPTMDGINTYFVSASAREAGLKVALSGLGGDEVFGGYETFRRTPAYQRVAQAGNHLPAGIRSAMASVMAETGGPLMLGDAARKLAALWTDSASLPDPYYFGRMVFTPRQVSGLMNGRTHAEGESLWWDWLAGSTRRARQLDSFAAVSCLEAESYLVNTLLRDTDSMSMAHSLEVRVPFLDHPLVEYVTHLPQEVKLSKGIPKALLVAALEDVLPSEVVHQSKRGFTFPWAAWLRGPLKEKIENGLSELAPALQEVLDSKTVQSVWQSYLDGKTTWSRPWSLFVLNEWVKKNVG